MVSIIKTSQLTIFSENTYCENHTKLIYSMAERRTAALGTYSYLSALKDELV
jgi:hypothetical protein